MAFQTNKQAYFKNLGIEQPVTQVKTTKEPLSYVKGKDVPKEKKETSKDSALIQVKNLKVMGPFSKKEKTQEEYDKKQKTWKLIRKGLMIGAAVVVVGTVFASSAGVGALATGNILLKTIGVGVIGGAIANHRYKVNKMGYDGATIRLNNQKSEEKKKAEEEAEKAKAEQKALKEAQEKAKQEEAERLRALEEERRRQASENQDYDDEYGEEQTRKHR